MRTPHYGIVAMLQSRPGPVSVEINIDNANSADLAQSLFVDVDYDPLVMLWRDR